MLFTDIVYGPIHSRRLGISLGMEIMPLTSKLCTFDCIYCECGFNQAVSHPVLPTVEEVSEALENKLRTLAGEHIVPDVITFSGNGEPTLHPAFLPIMEQTCHLRDEWCEKAKVSVLSNSTQLFRSDVMEALRLADKRIMKLDSAIDVTMHLIDQPVNKGLDVETILTYLESFQGDFTLQTCLLRGEYKGHVIDNTRDKEVEAWWRAVERVRPREVMLYVIDRETPVKTLEKIDRERMEEIAKPLRERGIEVIISA